LVQDDGRGVDWQAVRARSGLESATEAVLAELLFRPGFSTASDVGEHAGRGVGLDLVRDRVEAAGGAVEVHTESGSYTAFRIVLPAGGPAESRGGGA
jgi:chemotaxis protein histidine kinase CheA